MNCEHQEIINELLQTDENFFKPREPVNIIQKIHNQKPTLSGVCIAEIMKELVFSRNGTVDGLISIGYEARFVNEKMMRRVEIESDGITTIIFWPDY